MEDESDEAGRLPVLPRVSFASLQRTYNMEERGLMLSGDACNNAGAQRITFNDTFGFGHGDSSSVKGIRLKHISKLGSVEDTIAGSIGLETWN